MGIFGDLDVASASDNPWAVPANTYEATVYTAEVKRDKNEVLGLELIYKISSGDHEGKTVREWKVIPEPNDPKHLTPEENKAASYLKMRLRSFGIPESRMNSLNINDVLGLDVVIKVVVNGEYTNVQRVDLAGDAPAVNDSPNFVPFGA
jgi:hypothetical protein